MIFILYALVVNENNLLDVVSLQDKNQYNQVGSTHYNSYMEALKAVAANFDPCNFSKVLTLELKKYNLYVDKYRFLDIVRERDVYDNPIYMYGLTFIFHSTVFNLNLHSTTKGYIIPVDEDLRLHYTNNKLEQQSTNEHFPEGEVTQWVDLWLRYSTFTIRDVCCAILNGKYKGEE